MRGHACARQACSRLQPDPRARPHSRPHPRAHSRCAAPAARHLTHSGHWTGCAHAVSLAHTHIHTSAARLLTHSGHWTGCAHAVSLAHTHIHTSAARLLTHWAYPASARSTRLLTHTVHSVMHPAAACALPPDSHGGRLDLAGRVVHDEVHIRLLALLRLHAPACKFGPHAVCGVRDGAA